MICFPCCVLGLVFILILVVVRAHDMYYRNLTFGKSVKMTLTFLKWGLGSPLGLPKF
jgi:hypothetical protein